jgi:dolichol-phosphate mannosyltransferase
MLPAYHEERNLPPLLADFREMFAAWPGAPAWSLLVVDDGSKDGTAAAARSVPGVPLTVITHAVNQGLGAAMRTGITYALEHGSDDDLLVTMDADHTHPPELVPSMVALADAGSDFVIASRYQPGAEIHGLVWWRRWLSDAASLVFRAVFPCGARDYTCGFRCYRIGLLRWGQARYGRHFLNQRGFSVMVDLLLTAPPGLTSSAARARTTQAGREQVVVRTIVTTLRLLGRRFVGVRGVPREATTGRSLCRRETRGSGRGGDGGGRCARGPRESGGSTCSGTRGRADGGGRNARNQRSYRTTSGPGSSVFHRTRPCARTRRRPARFSTPRCLRIANLDRRGKAAQQSPVVRGPARNRSRRARRVGSASAWNTGRRSSPVVM